MKFGHPEDASQRRAFFQGVEEYSDLAEKLYKEIGPQFSSDATFKEKEKSVLGLGDYSNLNEMLDTDRRA